MDNKALMPEYMRQFNCIGAECEDTCCAFWNVSVDQDTYRKYLNVRHPVLKDRLKKDVKVKKANERTKKIYAEMKLNPDTGACCFHDGGLCSIHGELGESYLSKTCATYPRNVNEINKQQEVSAVLSCPEAARLALLNPSGIDFVYEDSLTKTNVQWNARVDTDSPKASPLFKGFWELRVLTIEILQNRKFSLPHRFMQLAVLADRVDESIAETGGLHLMDVMEQLRGELEQNGGITDSSIFPTNHQFQLKFLNEVLQAVIEQKLWHNLRYKQCLDEYIQGMQQAGNGTIQDIVSYYDGIYGSYYLPFIDKYEYVLENYLVNYVYSTLFPLSESGTMFKKVLYLGVLFTLLRTHLIGMSAVHKEITPEMAVKLIQSFTKNFDHSQQFKQIVNEKCKTEQINLGYLSLLVMND